MPSFAERYKNEIVNTLRALRDSGLVDVYQRPEIHKTALPGRSGELHRISWPNHHPGGLQGEDAFGTIEQVLGFLRCRAYLCVLNDCSVIRASFLFARGRLQSESLQYWPSPFAVTPDEIQEQGHADAIEARFIEEGYYREVYLRSPVRLDFSPNSQHTDHPSCHLHIQSPGCRLPVDRPICFNRFLKFVFRFFYPEAYESSRVFDDLEEMELEADGVGVVRTGVTDTMLVWGR